MESDMKLEIISELREILVTQRIVNPDTDIQHLPLLGAGGVMDSLTAMRFIDAVERRFRVDIMSDLNMDCMESTDHLADYILSGTRQSGQAPQDSPCTQAPQATPCTQAPQATPCTQAPQATPYIVASTPGQIVIGRHLIMDCQSLPDTLLNDCQAVQTLIHALAEAIDATIVEEAYHAFSPAGVTGLAIVSASHIAVHTWPEYGYMGVDIFSCQELDAEKLQTVITMRYAEANCHLRLFDRITGAGN